MEIEETAQTADVKTEEHLLCDLPVNDEEANETNGGNNLLNYTKVMLRDTQ
jgi:hypothetical protein